MKWDMVGNGKKVLANFYQAKKILSKLEVNINLLIPNFINHYQRMRIGSNSPLRKELFKPSSPYLIVREN